MTNLLTLEQAAQLVGLRSAEGFSRLARRTGIPLVRLSAKVVRVDPRDLDDAIVAHRTHPELMREVEDTLTDAESGQ